MNNAINYLIAIFIAISSSSVYANIEELIIGGTGNGLGGIKLISKGFMKKYPTIKVKVLPSLGSGGAIKAIKSNAIQLGILGRDLKQKEKRNDLQIIKYASTPTIFSVNKNNTINDITTSEITDIYSGKKSVWSNGTIIRPILRSESDSNTEELRALSINTSKAVDIANKQSGLPFGLNDQDTANKLEDIPGSFGMSTLALMLTENRNIKALRFNGIEPTPENFANGTYPLGKEFFTLIKINNNTTAKLFISFLRSSEGRLILETSGHYVI
ncbi:substrate-binding domain-containing protein [Aliivibrio salmonicida]|uniref:substrate-binding domain-containing protein n=1 Tax=Aliivibrio salmonicida TaxID=40269 RepID=UPI00406C11ED